MKILFFKSAPANEAEKMPLPDKLRLIFRARVKEAKTPDELERAERELARLEAGLAGK